MLTNYISWVVFGVLAGWIVSRLTQAISATATFTDILVGITATFLTGLVLQTLTSDKLLGFNVAILIVSIIVAVVVLFILQGFTRHLQEINRYHK